LKAGDNCYSQLIIAKELNVNPATAAKGINLLVQKGILEKQRGQSMIIANGAKELLLKERKGSGIVELISNLISEANKLKISQDDLINLLNDQYLERGNKNE